MRSLSNAVRAMASAAVLVAALAVSAAEPSMDSNPAREMWMKGFIKLKDASVAEKAGNALLAVQKYEESQQVFEEIQRQYPGWQSELVAYRTHFCAEKVKVLNTTLAAGDKEMSKEELASMVGTLKVQVKEFQEQAFSAQEKVEAMKATGEKSGAATGDEATALKEQIQRLEQEKSQLAAQLEQDKDRGALRKRVAALEDENRKLADQKVRFKEVQELKALAVSLEQKLTEQGQSRSDLQVQLATLVSERETLNNRLTAITTQLEDLRAQAERLQRENEALRKQL